MFFKLHDIFTSKFLLIFTSAIFLNIINLIILIICARNFTNLEFGYFSIAQTIFLILYSLSFHNAHIYLHKIMSLNFEKGVSKMSSVFLIRFYTSIFLYLILCIIIIFTDLNNDLKKLILIFNVIIIIEPFTIMYSYFFIKKKFILLSTIAYFHSIFFLILKILAVFLFKNIFILAFCYVVEFFFLAIVLIYIDHISDKIFSTFKFSIKNIFKTLKKIYLLPFLSIFTVIALRIDVLMLAYFVDEVASGIYSISSRLVGICLIAGTLFSNIIYPDFAKSSNKYILQKNFQFLLSFSNLISLSLILCIFLFGDYYLQIFGDGFSISSNTLKILSINILIGTIVISWSNKQYISGNYFLIIVFQIMAILLNIILNYYFIPILFLNGAALATLLSTIISLALCLVFNPQDAQSIVTSFSIEKMIITAKRIFKVILLKKNPEKRENKKL